jgi:hypothetical protein
MSHKHNLDFLEEESILPPKHGKDKDKNYQSPGWKFYVKIKDQLSDLWYEFNSAVKDNTKVKHRDAHSFAKKKFKHREQRQYFEWMIGPKKIWEQEAESSNGKYVVPWLGDWHKRRQTGYWNTETREHIKGLTSAIKENVESSQAIRATAPFIVQELMRCVRLKEKIDDLFQGEPFDGTELNPKKQGHRFKQYLSMHREVWVDMQSRINMWMRIHGVNPDNPHEMQDMATLAQLIGQSSAASALTGMTAGLGINPSLPGQPVTDDKGMSLQVNGSKVEIPLDALLLAKHLVDHSRTFQKPLPAIDGEVIEVKKEDKVNGKDKHNGKAN